jgi:hypothetical protein
MATGLTRQTPARGSTERAEVQDAPFRRRGRSYPKGGPAVSSSAARFTIR